MNERPVGVDRLREALQRVDINELEAAAEAIGQQAVQIALERPAAPKRFEPTEEEERQRLLDAALADAIEMVNRHRLRLGRRVCSRPDGSVTRQVYELLRSMSGPDGGSDNDPSFQ